MKLITGVTVEEQMRRAKKILDEKVIPQEIEFEKRKNKKIATHDIDLPQATNLARISTNWRE